MSARALDRTGRRMRMTATSGSLLLLTAALWLSGSGGAAVAGPETQFRHGIGVTAMAWAAVEPGLAGRFAFPPFVGPSYTLTSAELQALRHTGFDFIRLAVDPGPFLQFNGAQRDDLDRVLIQRVRLILASDLGVIVDFHPSDMQPDYTAQALTAGVPTPLFASYLQLLRRTAALLGQLHSPRVALELMNEPPLAPEAWQPMLEAGYAAARRGASDLALVLEGGDEASAPALMQMRTTAFAGDAAVLYAFHYYEPYQFTHQGASWNPARYLADVPYPANARPLQDSIDATATALAAADLTQSQKVPAGLDAQMRLRSYFESGFDGNAIAGDFDRIAGWARSQNISPEKILLGEFGARETELQRSGAHATEREQWFHDISRRAADHGFGWAAWAYRGDGGFALAKSATSNEIEPNVAAALGLRPPRAEAIPAGRGVVSASRR